MHKTNRTLSNFMISVKIYMIRLFSRLFGNMTNSKEFKSVLNISKNLGRQLSKFFIFIYSIIWIIALFTYTNVAKFLAPFIKVYIFEIRPKIWNFTSTISHRKLSRVSVVFSGAIIGLAFTAASMYNVGLLVSVNGQTIGYIEHEEELLAVVSDIENSVSEVLEKPYTLESDITFSLSVNSPDSFLSYDELKVILSEGVTEISPLAVVTVDGVIIGALSDFESAQNVLDEVKLFRADGDKDAEIEFMQDVKIELSEISVTMKITEEQLFERLNATSEGEHVYKVKSGDTISEIAQEHDMKTSEVLSLNPDVSSEDIQIGQEIVISAEIPTLSARVTKNVEYIESIPFDTVTEENDDMTADTKKTLQEGVEGSASVSAQIVTVDGMEVERTILEHSVIKAPTEEIVEVGTKVVQSTYQSRSVYSSPSSYSTISGTGDMLRPFSGYVSSNYGYRSSGFHTGVDFAGSSGSTIVAADSGRVVFSGWNGGYGNCVIIDHGNGVETLYAHNSSNSVSAGDAVSRGQKIGSVGSTGNSTGPHVHFEVRINGSHVNPWGYLN